MGETVTSASSSHFYSPECRYSSQFRGFFLFRPFQRRLCCLFLLRDLKGSCLAADGRSADGGSSSGESFHTSRLDRLPPARQRAGCKRHHQRPAAPPTSGPEEEPTGLQATPHPPPAAGRLLKRSLEPSNERRPSVDCVGVSSASSSECSNPSIVSIVLLRLRSPSSRDGPAEQTTAVGARPAGVSMWEAAGGSGSVGPVRDAAAWASLWMLKHARGRAHRPRRRFWFVSRVLA